MANDMDIFSEFPPVSKREWLARIEKDLKGKPLADLEWSLGTLNLTPFLHPGDFTDPRPAPLAARPGWEIGEDVEAHDLLVANRQVLYALEMGVEAPRFLLDENLGDHRMASLLEGINLRLVSIHFFEKNKNANPRHLLEHFYHIAVQQHGDASGLRGSVNWEHDEAVVPADAYELVEFAQLKLPNFCVLPVNGHSFFKGENGVVEELANILRRAVFWLDVFDEKGTGAAETNRFLQFSISVGKNYFVEIAKLRALRLLWANVLKAYQVEKFTMPVIEVHMAQAAQSDDPHANMIQATTQAMAAVIGGADRLTVLPSDAFGSGGATGFSRRIARNVQHILKMESHLDWVSDPAAGSYFVEDLTGKMAAAAWQVFQEKQ